jgi:hypothetical protein
VLGYDLEQMGIDALRTHVPQTKDDDTGQIGPTGGEEIAEVKIMCSSQYLI